MREARGHYKFRESQIRKIANLGILPRSYDVAQAIPEGHKFTVDDLVWMDEAGILETDARLELIDGVIFEMAPIGRPHGNRVSDVARAFWERMSREIRVYIGSTIRLSDYTGPQPDIALLTPESSRDERNVPGPEDILLIVEVSDSTLPRDRREKTRRYAESGIPELWILMVKSEKVEVHRQPTPEGYADVRHCRRGDALTIQALPSVHLTVDDLLQ